MTKAMKAWASGALLANFVGMILLALSFQSTSSEFRFVMARDTSIASDASEGTTAYAVCVGSRTMAMSDTKGTVFMGVRDCPARQSARPAAIVTAQYPLLLYIGLALSSLGFLIQFVVVTRMPVQAN